MRYLISWSFNFTGPYTEIGIIDVSTKYEAAVFGHNKVNNHLAFIRVQEIIETPEYTYPKRDTTEIW